MVTLIVVQLVLVISLNEPYQGRQSMKPNFIRAAIVAWFAVLSGCNRDDNGVEPGVQEADYHHLILTAENQEVSGELLAIDLAYTRKALSPGPRVMEAFLRFSDNLRYSSATQGEAIVAAGKTLVVQKREKGLLRIMAFSATSISELDSGLLATLRFEKTGTGTATLEILTDRPIFAPAETNQGLLVSDPLRIAL